MKSTLVAALAISAVAIAGQGAAQQGGRLITADDIAAAQTLLDQIKPACDAGSDKRACGILAYSPEDCTIKKTDPHTRQVYNTYDDRSVRFQQGTGVIRRPPIALLAPLGIIGRDGTTTSYNNPQFVSWDEYQAGKKAVTICGKSERIEVKDFTLSGTLEKFLKANP